jgi:hypothetical protein
VCHQDVQVSSGERGSLSAGNGERTVPQGLGLADVTLERVVPRNVIIPLGQILLVLDHEPDALQRLPGVVVPPHLGNPVTQLDLVRDLSVLRVRGVVSVRHDPFVDTEDTTGLEDLEDLAIDAFKGRGVAGGLDGVDYGVGRGMKISGQRTESESKGSSSPDERPTTHRHRKRSPQTAPRAS